MSEWGSPEWQARNRAWLQQKMQPIDNAYRGLLDKLDYYIPGDYGGKSFGQSVDGLLNFTKEASPGADVRDMRDGSRQTMQGLLGGDMSQSLQGLGLLGLGTIGMVPGAGDVAKSVGKKARGIDAYHSSPHSFDNFKNEAIGTGEGAQAYGHGHYFAQVEDVAKAYKDAGIEVSPRLRMVLDNNDGDVAKSIKAMKKAIKQNVNGGAEVFGPLIEEAQRIPKGNTYKVRLNVDKNRLLDWDKPLREQTKEVQDAYKKAYMRAINTGDETGDLLSELFDGGSSLRNEDMGLLYNSKGGQSYKELKQKFKTPQELTDALIDSGLDGVQYFDQFSRFKNGNGTRNYVVFDPMKIEILKKYGLLAPLAAGSVGAGLLSQEGQKDY